MNVEQQERAMHVMGRALAALVPMQELEKLCETEKEYNRYLALREGIIIDLSEMIVLFMRLQHPDMFPIEDVEALEEFLFEKYRDHGKECLSK